MSYELEAEIAATRLKQIVRKESNLKDALETARKIENRAELEQLLSTDIEQYVTDLYREHDSAQDREQEIDCWVHYLLDNYVPDVPPIHYGYWF